ncbi:MAG: ABC transporter permease, partial [Oligoflexia bacterium]|nr:ABC transporter permease [Oligoflexia bacterium]
SFTQPGASNVYLPWRRCMQSDLGANGSWLQVFVARLRVLLVLAWRNVLRYRRRSLVTLSAISLGIWSAVSLAALARGVSNQMVEDGIRNFLGHAQVHAPRYLDDPSVDYSFEPPLATTLLGSDVQEIKAWAPRVRVPVVASSERESTGVTLMGIDPQQERGLSFIMEANFDGRPLDSRADQGLIIGAKLAELLKTGLGKRIVVAGQAAKDSGFSQQVAQRGFRIVGIFRAELEATERSFVFTGLATAQALLGLGTRVSEIALLTPKNRDKVDAFVDSLRSRLPELDIRPWYTIEPMLRALVKVQGGFLYLWFFIVITVVCFGLVNTLYMGVIERIREFGLVQSIGMRPELLRWQVLIESVLLLALGALVGTAMSLLTVHLLSGGIDLAAFAKGTQFVGIRSQIYPFLRTDDLLLVNALVLLMGLLSSMLPAMRASSLQPAQAFRSV